MEIMATIPETRIHPQTTVLRSWSVLRIFIGLVIMTAALMKAHMLSTTPILGDGPLNARWFNIIVVEFELVFGIWLLVGLMSKVTWIVTIGSFTTFAGVSFYKAFVLQETNCVCFGDAISINPWYTTAFDLIVVGLLICFRPHGILFQWRAFLSEMSELKRFKRVGIAVVVWMLLAVPMTHAIMSVKTNDLAELGIEFIGADGKKTILLLPEGWVGKELPLISRFVQPNDSEILKQGTWNVLLAQSDCPKCQEMKADLERRNAKGIAIVVIPSRANESHPQTQFPLFMLDKQNDWFVTTPCVVKLVDGICVVTGDHVTE